MKLMGMSTLGGVLLFFVMTSCRKEMADATEKLALNNHDTVFVHPGLMHKQSDFDRMKSKVDAGAEPWLSGWNQLIGNSHSALSWQPNPADTVYRGYDGVHHENYGQLYNDIAAAYATALRWKVSGDKLYAEKSIQIMNAWSARLKGIGGNNDANLAAGLYGYQFANAAEIMRTYTGWARADFARFQKMMLTVFYPMNHAFLARRERCMSHFYANWDLCVMNSILATGVLCDDRDIYNEAIRYFKYGAGNGAVANAVYFIHPDGLGQWQESGRDQGHTTLGIGLMGTFCEMAWNQGDDMYGYDNNRFLKGAEYVAAYNLGDSVSFKTYTNCVGVVQNVISSGSRGNIRPVWELVYNHYVNRKGLPAPNCTRFAQKVRPEGGGGNYGPNSGGYDQLGYGTLTFSLK
ncbi:alginate lyase family protein [Chitinophaga sp. 22321]|uniref:Alginate lyase family protein n=1 Tax=Chitinophaga hostae TaxID=2831022 RepID=A0ABS5J5T3_9BACT|nr:alginate lyase family protein [Chitinophaga hostae]MBS0030539.1 alginate lyase family protein [Chitinophaga hostae]